MEKTIEIMIRILKDKFDVEQELLPETLIEEIEIDSLDLIHFLFSLDEETGVEVQDQQLINEDIESLADLAAYVDKYRKKISK